MSTHRHDLEREGMNGTVDDWARAHQDEQMRDAARRAPEERHLVAPRVVVTGARLLGPQALLGVVASGILLLGVARQGGPAGVVAGVLIGAQVVALFGTVALGQDVPTGRRSPWRAGLGCAGVGILLASGCVLLTESVTGGGAGFVGLLTATVSVLLGLGAIAALGGRRARGFVAQRSVPRGRR